MSRRTLSYSLKATLIAAFVSAIPLNAQAAVEVTQTTDTAALTSALNASGLRIGSVSVVAGNVGQIGTYTNFNIPPVTIDSGIVLSTGYVSQVAQPPVAGNSPSTNFGGASTTEYTNYGKANIDNFCFARDVTALKVNFCIRNPGQIQFDAVFGTAESAMYKNNYADSFLVFLDGQQIAFDPNGNLIGAPTTNLTTDNNTAFGDPHYVTPTITVTSPVIPAGTHTLTFELGDVNDGLNDSAVFIANLRSDGGACGQNPPVPEPTTFLIWSILGGLGMVAGYRQHKRMGAAKD